jgi:hypothetical protein
MHRRLIFAVLVFLAPSGVPALGVQLPVDAPLSAPSAPLQTATLADYAKQVKDLQAKAAACAQKADACAATAVVDQRVSLSGGQSFNARYEWFGAALASARTLKDTERAAKIDAVEERLNLDLADAEALSAPAVNSAAGFSVARRKADAILADEEFQTAEQQSLWERGWTWLAAWIDRALARVVAFGSRSPWIGTLIEWGLAGLACVLLLAWALRLMRRQRLSLRLETERRNEAADERVLNWMREAELHAERGAFRDAVHCLYWASIATLEGRWLWPPDRARTPREYLRLLDSTSPAAGLLGRQTRSFESIWYGLRRADRSDYDRALTLHRELRSA